jgi:hypothetical protein
MNRSIQSVIGRIPKRPPCRRSPLQSGESFSLLSWPQGAPATLRRHRVFCVWLSFLCLVVGLSTSSNCGCLSRIHWPDFRVHLNSPAPLLRFSCAWIEFAQGNYSGHPFHELLHEKTYFSTVYGTQYVPSCNFQNTAWISDGSSDP